jgi:signal transduction histidine kinase
VATPVTPQEAGAAAGPVNILLVDDQPSRLLTYRAILGDLNEHLIEASSGTDALKLLMTHDFALILLDVNMPDMDGFETANLIHEHPRFENTPIIFVTAVNLSDLDRMRGYRVGAFDYVMVPIIPEILRSKVVVLAELHRKRRQLEVANRELATANETIRVEKARELEHLNQSLHLANAELASRNAQLQAENAERVRAESRLIDQDQRKDEFLAMLAHELRNPLAALANAINVFKLSASTPHPLHDAMSRQLGLLVRLIDDLLDVARISRGKLTLKPRTTMLNTAIDSAIETIEPMLTSGSYALKFDRPSSDVELYADSERLSQVFSNLLSNAVKYSDPGSSIEVNVHADAGMIEVDFIDHGIGLSPQHQSWIFELFAQVDTALERARGGLGIGLTLARNMVEMHDGQLLVQSDGLGRGSRFTVRLPRHATGDIAPIVPEVQQDAGAACRILVVDDNSDSADTLANILQLMGHAAHSVCDPRKVIETVDSFLPDIVFLDLGMPGISGYDIARNLRARPTTQHLVLVALTGWGQPEDRRRTEESGFDHHLVKPADLATIQQICNTPLPRHPAKPETLRT